MQEKNPQPPSCSMRVKVPPRNNVDNATIVDHGLSDTLEMKWNRRSSIVPAGPAHLQLIWIDRRTIVLLPAVCLVARKSYHHPLHSSSESIIVPTTTELLSVLPRLDVDDQILSYKSPIRHASSRRSRQSVDS